MLGSGALQTRTSISDRTALGSESGSHVKAMLRYRRTSLFESNAQTLVNTVNCVGVMGKGLAAEFKSRHPDMYKAYKRICDDGLLAPGKLWLWQTSNQWVLNFPTKVHWRNASKIEWIQAGLEKFVAEYQNLGIKSISFPRLGCGNGGLPWDEVGPLMERYLSDLNIDVFIHDFEKDIGTPEHITSIGEAGDEELYSDFNSFIDALRHAIIKNKGVIPDIYNMEMYSTFMTDDKSIIARNKDTEFKFEEDDVRALWLMLRRKGVSLRDAGHINIGSGSLILALIGALPMTRVIEYQRSDSDPELSVEISKRVGQRLHSLSDKQAELSWE